MLQCASSGYTHWDRRSPQTRLTPLIQGRKSVTRTSSARNGPMPIAAKASLKTSRVLATSARAASARAMERSEGCISANSSARPRVSRAVPQATVATMARPTSSSVADSTLKCLRGNHQIRTRKNLPPFPHGRSQGLKQEHMGRPCGPDTVWGTVYVQRDDELLENAVTEGARPPSPRYRARLSFRIALVLDASHQTSTEPLGRISRRPLCQGCRHDRRRSRSDTWPSATAAHRWRGSTLSPRSDPEVRPSPTTDRVDPRQDSRHPPSLRRPRCRWDIPAPRASLRAMSVRPE
jgi:hypothetical protein